MIIPGEWICLIDTTVFGVEGLERSSWKIVATWLGPHWLGGRVYKPLIPRNRRVRGEPITRWLDNHIYKSLISTNGRVERQASFTQMVGCIVVFPPSKSVRLLYIPTVLLVYTIIASIIYTICITTYYFFPLLIRYRWVRTSR